MDVTEQAQAAPTESSQPESAEINVDQLLSEIEGKSTNRNMQAPPEKTAAPAVEAKPAAPQLFEYNANGQTIKEPLDMVLRRASMGYDYAQKMEQFNKTQTEASELRSRVEQLARFEEFDKYAKENPAWMDHVNNQWNSRQQLNVDPNDPVASKLTEFESKLGKVDEVLKAFQDQKHATEQAQADSKFEQQLESIRKTHPDLDMKAVDESGKTLEYRFLEFAVEHKLDNAPMDVVFKAFYHDKLTAQAEERARQKMQAELVKNKREGILGRSPTPANKLTPTSNVRNKSYEDIMKETLAELGI